MFKHVTRRKDIVTRMATDAATANLMVADENLNIIYMNSAVTSLLQEAEADIRADLPHFSVATLVGSNIDVFHKNPSHQRKMLENLSATYRATIQVGGRTFDLVATPLKEKDGRRMGTLVEWTDATIRLQICLLRRSRMRSAVRKPWSSSIWTARSWPPMRTS